MNLKEAIEDPTIRKSVTGYLAEYYAEDLADDAWQQVALDSLMRIDSPVFATPNLARNYLVRAAKSRAINLQVRQLANVAKSDLDVFGEDAKINMVLDTRPNPEEALEAAQCADTDSVLSTEVQWVLSAFPPAVQASFRILMHGGQKGQRKCDGWTTALAKAEKLSLHQAAVRLQYLRVTYFPRLAHLRAVHGERPRLSGKRNYGKGQISV